MQISTDSTTAMSMSKKSIIKISIIFANFFGALSALAQTEFLTLEEALSFIHENIRPGLRYRLEKQIQDKPVTNDRNVISALPVENKLIYAKERLEKDTEHLNRKTLITPLDVSGSTLGECHTALALPYGAVVKRDGTLNGFMRFFQCPSDNAVIRLVELAWQTRVTNAFTIRELTTTDLDVGGIPRRAVLVRNLDPNNNTRTKLSWRHGDRLLELIITGIGSEQEKRLRDIARTL